MTLDEAHLKLIKEADEFLLKTNQPKDFTYNSSTNEMRIQGDSFERVCISLEGVGVSNPGELMTYQFYKRLEYYEEKYKDTKKK